MGLLDWLFDIRPSYDKQDNPAPEDTEDPHSFGYGDLVDLIHDTMETAPSDDIDISSDVPSDVDADVDASGDEDGSDSDAGDGDGDGL